MQYERILSLWARVGIKTAIRQDYKCTYACINLGKWFKSIESSQSRVSENIVSPSYAGRILRGSYPKLLLLHVPTVIKKAIQEKHGMGSKPEYKNASSFHTTKISEFFEVDSMMVAWLACRIYLTLAKSALVTTILPISSNCFVSNIVIIAVRPMYYIYICDILPTCMCI